MAEEETQNPPPENDEEKKEDTHKFDICMKCKADLKDRVPKLLPCLHTFCEACLNSESAEPEDGKGEGGQFGKKLKRYVQFKEMMTGMIDPIKFSASGRTDQYRRSMQDSSLDIYIL